MKLSLMPSRRPGGAVTETRQLIVGDECIHFQINRSPRRQKTVSIRVRPDGRVQVAAPAWTSDAEIDALVAHRAHWVSRHLFRVRNQSRVVRQPCYVNDERHWYLGRQYPLIINRYKNKKSAINIHDDRIEVCTRLNSPAAVRDQMLAWYRDRSNHEFPCRLNALLPRLPWQPEQPPRLRLRYMKRRWGSCTAQGVITLNPHLIKAPAECVDFVIAHELCHLQELNHSPRFYRLLDQVLPGWPATSAKLDDMAGQLLVA